MDNYLLLLGGQGPFFSQGLDFWEGPLPQLGVLHGGAAIEAFDTPISYQTIILPLLATKIFQYIW